MHCSPPVSAFGGKRQMNSPGLPPQNPMQQSLSVAQEAPMGTQAVRQVRAPVASGTQRGRALQH
jgi:hypothetical protein